MAAELRVCVDTVGKWRSRFLEQRLDGLLDQPRSGRPRMIDDADVERVIALTLEATPKDATHWSTRSMARRSGLSHNTVSRIWRAFALQPHRTETFKLSADPLFIEKVRDIVGLYLNPPDRALVLSVDEKSQIQALDRTRPLLPLRPGQAELRTAMQPPLEVCSGLKTSVRVLFMSKPARVRERQPFQELRGSLPAILRADYPGGWRSHPIYIPGSPYPRFSTRRGYRGAPLRLRRSALADTPCSRRNWDRRTLSPSSRMASGSFSQAVIVETACHKRVDARILASVISEDPWLEQAC